MAYFPVVGLLLGIILVISNKILSRYIPYPLTDILLLILLVFLTGGLHLDGLADSIDALAGSRDREEALRIMKDGRIGAIGSLSLVLLLMTKYLSLTALDRGIKDQAIMLMPVIGRWAMVPAAYLGTYARREEGIGKAFVDNVGMREFILATVTAILLVLFFFKIKGIYIIIASILVFIGIFYYLKRRISGMTGDTLGAICELLEVSFLLFVIIFYPEGKGE